MGWRVLLVEDEAWVREDVARAVHRPDEGFELAAACGLGREAVKRIEEGLAFDAAIVDLGLPDVPGQAVLHAIRRLRPAAVAVAFTVFDDPETVVSALRAGARGYLLKSTPVSRLLGALAEAFAGGSPMSPSIARIVVERLAGPQCVAADEERMDALTRREREVLTLLAKGHTYADVGRALSIGLSTVQSHVRAIYGKLEVASKAEAASLAVKIGLA